MIEKYYPEPIQRVRVVKTNDIATLAEVKHQLRIIEDVYDTEVPVFMNEAKHIIETRLGRSLDDCVYKVKYCLSYPKKAEWLALVVAPVASVSVHGTTETETVITGKTGITLFWNG